MNIREKKKVLVPIFYRGHYGRLRSVLKAIQDHPNLELQIMVAERAVFGSFLTNLRHSEPRSLIVSLPWYMRARLFSLLRLLNFWSWDGGGEDFLTKKLKEDGYYIHSRIPFFLDGGAPATMAKSVGIGILRIVDELKRLKPDIVFVNADRFEMMAVTIAAAYLNIPIAHNEAGDVSGTIDESVRHAITKFAHIHFTSTNKSRLRVLRMGEHPDRVFVVGSPAVDLLKKVKETPESSFYEIDTSKPYLLVMVHPTTTISDTENRKVIHSVLAALERLNLPSVIIGSNSDAGSGVIGSTIVEWCQRTKLRQKYFIKHAHPDRFYRILAQAACAVGNSSSFVREGAFFGTPAVIVGNRQQNRERGKNVIEVIADVDMVENAVKTMLVGGRLESDFTFGDGKAGVKIAEVLATLTPPIQKIFYE